jgi:hypothetical protein
MPVSDTTKELGLGGYDRGQKSPLCFLLIDSKAFHENKGERLHAYRASRQRLHPR